MPDLPPIREDATLDASQYVAALQAMAAEARAAAAAENELNAALAATQKLMDSMAAGAAQAAAAENNLADAERSAASGASAAAAAENAAADAAAKLARNTMGAAAAEAFAARNAAAFISSQRTVLAAEAAASRMADQLKDALDAVAASEQFAATEAEHLAEAQAAGSLAAAQDAQQAKVLAEADAVLAAAQNVAADTALRVGSADAYLGTIMSFAERQALGLAGAMGATAVANRAAADAANAGGQAVGVQVGWLRLGAANWATFLHWVIAGSAEFLAVAIPAAVALGAGLAVAAQGAQNVQQHFTALYAATESTYAAMHQTVGSVLGLGSALQNAQNAADPGVYELLGSVVNDAKSSFMGLAGVGLQVVHMFDEFAARVTVDLKTGLGTEVQGLLSGMVTDLHEFGNVLGNLGHALLNFAAAMPGLAHLLLAIAVGISEVVMWASRAGPLLTMAMGLEEMYRWGGLVLTMLVRLTGQMGVMDAMGAGNFITRFGAALLTLVNLGGNVLIWAGAMIGRLAGVSAAFGTMGTSVTEAGAAMGTFAAETSPAMMAGIAAAVAIVGYLAYKLITLKTATEQWIAASDQAVAKASDLNVLPTIYNQLASTLTRASAAQRQYSADTQHFTQNVVFAGRAGQIMSQSMINSGQSAVQLSQHMLSLIATANTVRGNISLLAGVFHTSEIGALALANAAGVNLQVGLTKSSTAAKIAEQQITNLKTGLGAMAAPAGVIGADMEAVGIQSQLASSKVQTVNQALDAFIASTTGGMNGVMQFNAALRSMGKDTVAGSHDINGAITSISNTAAKMGYTLQGFGPKAQQSWQQFDAAVQQGNSVLDTMRTGMAEGVVSWSQYNNEIKAVGGSLLPFAAHNKTALAIVSQLSQEMGNPATHSLRTLANEFGITGRAAQAMATMGMERAAARMANLSQVARNLSATISGQLDSAMASAIVKASGLDQAYSKWATDVMHNAAPQTLKADLAGITNAQNLVNAAQAKAVPLLNQGAKAAGSYGTALKGASTNTNDFTGSLGKSHAALADAVARANDAARSTQGFGTQAHTAGSAATGLAANANQANTAVRTLGTSATTTRASLGTVNNEIRTTASAASASAGPLGAMIGNIRSVGASAMTAAGQVRSLQAAIASLQSKTITVTTNVVTVTSTVHRAMGGPVFPGVPTVVGEAGREMYIPAVPGYIVPHAQTEQLLAGAGGSGGGAGGGAPQAINLQGHIQVPVQVDGQTLMTSVQPYALRFFLRNGYEWTQVKGR